MDGTPASTLIRLFASKRQVACNLVSAHARIALVYRTRTRLDKIRMISSMLDTACGGIGECAYIDRRNASS